VLDDLKYGIRVLRKNPGFTIVAVLVLALGIGANSAIFSVVNAVLLRPLPFHDSSRLVQIWHTPPQKSFPGMTEFAVSAANYLDWRSQNSAFEKMAIYTFREINLIGKDRAEMVRTGAVSSDFFSVLESQPLLGRVFSPEEDSPGQNHVVILSHAFWQTHFGSDPKIVGQQVNFDGQAYTVTGVMRPQFTYPSFAQVWTPLAMTDQEKAVRGEHHYLVVGRLKPGTQLAQAQAEMSTISHRLEQQYPADDNGWGAVVVPLRQEIVGDVRPALLVLLGAVAFVLLIACANVANLTLAKTFSRQKEIAIRTALGASRLRILRQVLAETILLALVGGALGLFFAQFGVNLIVAFLGDKLPRSTEITLDSWVLAFTAVVSIGTGAVAGLLPALRLTKNDLDLNQTLKQGLGRSGSDSGGNRTRNILVGAEVALSLMLLIGAGLMIRSLLMLRSVDPGFDPQNTLSMTLAVPNTKYTHPAGQIDFFNRVLEKVRALPGVDSAGVIDDLPVSPNGGSHQPFTIEGRPILQMADQPEVDVRLISTQYVRAMHIPILQGRDFSEADNAQAPAAVLISQSLAKRFWPNESPIGRRLTMTFFPDKVREVIGVIGDVKQDGLGENEPAATIYMPLAQISVPAMGGWRSFGMSLVVRSHSDPATLTSAVTHAVHEVDSQTPVLDIETMKDFVADSLTQQRFNMLLLAVFAALALVLAAVGIYSVLAYSVRRRIREIGIRMALGAQIRDVLRLVVVEGMKPAIIGLLIGLFGALALGRVLSGLIFGVKPTDPVTYAAVSVLLAMVALCATLIPAYRATRVDPMKTLHEE